MLALKMLWLFLNILQMGILLTSCENSNYETFRPIYKFKRSAQSISNDFQNNSKLTTIHRWVTEQPPFEKEEFEINEDLFADSASDLDEFILPGATDSIENDASLEDPFEFGDFQSGESNTDMTTQKTGLTSPISDILQIWLNEQRQNDALEKNLLNDDATTNLDLQYLEQNINFVKFDEKLRGAVANVTQIPDVYEKINFENNGQILNLSVLNGSLLDASSSPGTTSAYVETTTTVRYEIDQLVSNRRIFGIARDRNDLTCIALNLTLDIEYKELPLDLDTNTLVVDGGCDPFDAFVEFKWSDVENLGNLSVNFGVICKEELCYVTDVFIKIKFTNGNKLYAQKNVKMFVTEPEITYDNSTSISIRMEKDVKIKLSDVRFFVSKHFREAKALIADSQISEYYSKLLGATVGLILLIIFTTVLIYFVRRWKKSKGEKKDLTST